MPPPLSRRAIEQIPDRRKRRRLLAHWELAQKARRELRQAAVGPPPPRNIKNQKKRPERVLVAPALQAAPPQPLATAIPLVRGAPPPYTQQELNELQDAAIDASHYVVRALFMLSPQAPESLKAPPYAPEVEAQRQAIVDALGEAASSRSVSLLDIQQVGKDGRSVMRFVDSTPRPPTGVTQSAETAQAPYANLIRYTQNFARICNAARLVVRVSMNRFAALEQTAILTTAWAGRLVARYDPERVALLRARDAAYDSYYRIGSNQNRATAAPNPPTQLSSAEGVVLRAANRLQENQPPLSVWAANQFTPEEEEAFAAWYPTYLEKFNATAFRSLQRTLISRTGLISATGPVSDLGERGTKVFWTLFEDLHQQIPGPLRLKFMTRVLGELERYGVPRHCDWSMTGTLRSNRLATIALRRNEITEALIPLRRQIQVLRAGRARIVQTAGSAARVEYSASGPTLTSMYRRLDAEIAGTVRGAELSGQATDSVLTELMARHVVARQEYQQLNQYRALLGHQRDEVASQYEARLALQERQGATEAETLATDTLQHYYDALGAEVKALSPGGIASEGGGSLGSTLMADRSAYGSIRFGAEPNAWSAAEARAFQSQAARGIYVIDMGPTLSAAPILEETDAGAVLFAQRMETVINAAYLRAITFAGVLEDAARPVPPVDGTLYEEGVALVQEAAGQLAGAASAARGAVTGAVSRAFSFARAVAGSWFNRATVRGATVLLERVEQAAPDSEFDPRFEVGELDLERGDGRLISTWDAAAAAALDDDDEFELNLDAPDEDLGIPAAQEIEIGRSRRPPQQDVNAEDFFEADNDFDAEVIAAGRRRREAVDYESKYQIEEDEGLAERLPVAEPPPPVSAAEGFGADAFEYLYGLNSESTAETAREVIAQAVRWRNSATFARFAEVDGGAIGRQLEAALSVEFGAVRELSILDAAAVAGNTFSDATYSTLIRLRDFAVAAWELFPSAAAATTRALVTWPLMLIGRTVRAIAYLLEVLSTPLLILNVALLVVQVFEFSAWFWADHRGDEIAAFPPVVAPSPLDSSRPPMVPSLTAYLNSSITRDSIGDAYAPGDRSTLALREYVPGTAEDDTISDFASSRRADMPQFTPGFFATPYRCGVSQVHLNESSVPDPVEAKPLTVNGVPSVSVASGLYVTPSQAPECVGSVATSDQPLVFARSATGLFMLRQIGFAGLPMYANDAGGLGREVRLAREDSAPWELAVACASLVYTHSSTQPYARPPRWIGLPYLFQPELFIQFIQGRTAGSWSRPGGYGLMSPAVAGVPVPPWFLGFLTAVFAQPIRTNPVFAERAAGRSGVRFQEVWSLASPEYSRRLSPADNLAVDVAIQEIAKRPCFPNAAGVLSAEDDAGLREHSAIGQEILHRPHEPVVLTRDASGAAYIRLALGIKTVQACTAVWAESIANTVDAPYVPFMVSVSTYLNTWFSDGFAVVENTNDDDRETLTQTVKLFEDTLKVMACAMEIAWLHGRTESTTQNHSARLFQPLCAPYDYLIPLHPAKTQLTSRVLFFGNRAGRDLFYLRDKDFFQTSPEVQTALMDYTPASPQSSLRDLAVSADYIGAVGSPPPIFLQVDHEADTAYRATVSLMGLTEDGLYHVNDVVTTPSAYSVPSPVFISPQKRLPGALPALLDYAGRPITSHIVPPDGGGDPDEPPPMPPSGKPPPGASPPPGYPGGLALDTGYVRGYGTADQDAALDALIARAEASRGGFFDLPRQQADAAGYYLGQGFR